MVCLHGVVMQGIIIIITTRALRRLRHCLTAAFITR